MNIKEEEEWGNDLLQYILSLPQQPVTAEVINQLNEKIHEAVCKKGDEAIAVVKKARMILIKMSEGDK